jgi:D-alanine-D-alanine ligase-like ATP-grasp enzyme
MYHPFTSLILAELAPQLGIRLELEPDYQFAGELIFPNGRRHLFHNTNFNLNGAAARHIADDKGYTAHFLRKHGFAVPQHQSFFSTGVNAKLPPRRQRTLSDAQAYAATLGYPVFVKPNNLSQGAFVTKVHDAAQLHEVGQQIFAHADVLLVEQALSGRDYRVVVLAGQVMAAYERIPLSVMGDGQHDIHALLLQAQEAMREQGRANAGIDLQDSRIDAKLQQQGLTRASRPATGQRVLLLDNANLSTGGSSVDLGSTIHPGFAELAIRASTTLGLALAGIDFIAADLSTPPEQQTWHILELNAAPGLENYAALGPSQHARVVELYRQVLQLLAQCQTAEFAS